MSERHQDLTLNHRLESYVYADAAARTGASGFVSGDIGRIAYQSDNGSYWRLLSTVPAWQRTEGVATGFYQSVTLSPTGTASTAGVMMGCAGTITPVRTGRVFLSAQGNITTSAAGGGNAGIRYGTGTAPANGAAVVGTPAGPTASMLNASAGLYVPISMSGLIGVTLGTTYWFDVALASQAGTTTVNLAIVLLAFEV